MYILFSEGCLRGTHKNMQKNIFIMGDSYSTYGGYIPQGYNCYYDDLRTDEPVIKGVEKTWWKILVNRMDYNIAMNDSFSGSTVCNTGYNGDCSKIYSGCCVFFELARWAHHGQIHSFGI